MQRPPGVGGLLTLVLSYRYWAPEGAHFLCWRCTEVEATFRSSPPGSLVTAANSLLADALRDRYILERELGRGGMATVYLARDLRHDRLVALKVILPELGAVLGPERFLSEIRVTSHLQHPNLLPLFDSGEAAGLLYYTMPYVEGESLRQRLLRERQLPVNEAVRMAAAIAGALDYAHRHGVLHRDLKPENILLADDQPVVADFGIALAVSKAGGTRVTQTGLSLGTPQYMSPEQATGDRALDARTDVYSLGVVLYEMLTGDPPHTGSTVQAVIAKVLTEKPRSMRAVRDTIPEHVDAAVDCALAKLPADRWPTAAQFASALQDGTSNAALVGLYHGRTSTALHWHQRVRHNRIWAILPWGLLGAAVLALAAREWGTPRVHPAPVRFTLSIPESQRLIETLPFTMQPIATSPDGRAIAYVGRAGGGSMLYRHRLDELGVKALAGTESAQTPFFSYDGRWIAFLVPGREQGFILKKVRTDGGSVATIAEVPGPARAGRLGPGIVGVGGAWSADNVIVLGSERGLLRVGATGGMPQQLTTVDTMKGEVVHAWPRFLPDGRGLIFGIMAGPNQQTSRLATASLDDTAHVPLLERGAIPLGVLSGALIFAPGDGTLAAVPFDLRRRRLTGEPITIVDSVQAASISETGTLVYVRGSGLSRLALVDMRGSRVGGSEDWRQYDFPRISPDGRRIAVGIREPGSARLDIWVYDIASKVLSRLTTTGEAFRPEWTPDGRRIAYLGTGSLQWQLWSAPADGSAPGQLLYRSPTSRIGEITFAPGGKLAVLRADYPKTGRDIVLLSLTGDSSTATMLPLANTAANEIQPRVSPDGRWLAYVSDETGQLEVYVRPFPGAGGRIQISSGGGSEPAWSVDGKRLFYRAGGHFMAATLAVSPSLNVVSREEMFEDRYKSGLFRSRFDVHPNGKHFVMLQPAAQSQDVVVVVDWATELGSRLIVSASASRP
jgi:Tol biopolymer transport system component